MKKEIPILYQTIMVQAILDGRKTKTRRTKGLEFVNDSVANGGTWKYLGVDELGHLMRNNYGATNAIKCPYGEPGDILWVRESFSPFADKPWTTSNISYRTAAVDAKDKRWKWKPSIHMPKACSRIWLEVTDIKIERLQDISEQDAIAEGVESWIDERLKSKPIRYRVYEPNSDPEALYSSAAYDSFQTLWESINGIESWNLNSWVWVVSFKVLSKTGKPDYIDKNAQAFASLDIFNSSLKKHFH